MRIWLLILALIQTKSSAQELFVFSDLALLSGLSVLKPGCDNIPGWGAFEPLSPALSRGDRMVFVIAVSERAGKPFVLQTGQFPADSLPLKMYRLFPDTDAASEPVEVPVGVRGRIPESQRCALFLLEVAVPMDAPAGRLKLEPALWIPDSLTQDFWLRYPMEVRILDTAARVPKQCKPLPTRLEQILSGSLAPWLESCPDPVDWASLARLVAAKRREEGKNR